MLVLRAGGNPADLVQQFERAEHALAARSGDFEADAQLCVAAALLARSEILQNAGEEDGARELVERMQTRFGALYGEPLSIRAVVGYGSSAAALLADLGEEAAAETVCLQLLDAVELSPSQRVEISGQIAGLAEARGDWPVARDTLDEAEAWIMGLELERAVRLGALARVASLRGRHYRTLGVLDLASAQLRAAESDYRQLGSVPPGVLVELGELWTLSESFLQLLESLARWREQEAWLTEPTTQSQIRAALLLGFSELGARSELEREGGTADLDELDERFAELARSIQQSAPQLGGVLRQIQRQRADLALRRGRPEDASDLLEALEAETSSRSSLDEEALQVTLLTRTALALSAPRERLAELRARAEDAVEAQFASWRRARRPSGSIGFLFPAFRRQLLSARIELELQLDPRRGAERGLELLLRAQSMAREDLAVPTLAQLRERFLGPGHAALVILPGKDDGETHVFVVDDETLVHRRAASRDALRSRGESLGSLLAGLDAAEPQPGARELRARQIRSVARRLGQLLLPPEHPATERVRAATTLTVVGAELISNAPPDAWVIVDDLPLAVTHAVQSSASLPGALEAATRTREPFEHGLGVVANLALDAPLENALPLESFDVPDELLAPWRAPFEQDSWTLTGVDVTRAALAKAAARLRRSACLVFLLHGVSLPELERGAALLLRSPKTGAPEYLTCEAVERAGDLRGLVLLTACGTAIGPERLGDDQLAGLSGAVLRAGASAVLTSRNVLRLDDVHDLNRRLLAKIAEGIPATEALLQARRARSQAGDALTPYEDARHQLHGAGHVALWEN